MPPGGTAEWARWHLRHSFKPDDAAIIEWLTTWAVRHARLSEYAIACHVRKWAGWQATLAWGIVETLAEPLDMDDDIPF
jgi:hypothetical protein